MKLGLLCSGNLGYKTLINLVKTENILFVCTDKGSDSIISFCKEKNIALFVGNPRKGKAYHFIKSVFIDVIISVNYLFLIDEDIIKHSHFIFNIHGSLLPKYRGRTPHVWAIINNEIKTGITAHKIEIGCDTGAIIEQLEVPISKTDTGATILKKYETLYLPLIKGILLKVKNNKIVLRQQDELLATYFGKRTPKDGLIDWNWSKERIYNWIRAQANPYPGAFTFYNGIKVIIDKIKFSNLGFNFNTPNGTIIESDKKIIVKTPNGAIELLLIRNNVKLEKGKIFTNEDS